MSAQSNSRLSYDSANERWYCQTWNTTTGQWDTEWLPVGWTPPQAPKLPSTPQPPKRRDSGNTRLSPTSSPLQNLHTSSGASVSPLIVQTPPVTQSINTNYASLGQASAATGQDYTPTLGPAHASHISNEPYAESSNHHAPSAPPSVSLDLPRGRGGHITGSYTGKGKQGASKVEKLDPAFRVRDKGFFKEGRVFAVIMSEPAGKQSTMDYNTTYSGARNMNIEPVKYKDNLVHTQTRRFVVVRRKREFCFACPIFTYGGRATLKGGVRPDEHGIIYSLGTNPTLLKNETGITKASIGVKMAPKEGTLDVASRIYYGIHHPIQYNVKVKDIGRVPESHVPSLVGSWQAEQMKEISRSTEEEEDDEDGPDDPPVTDPHIYDPQNNTYGYDVNINPHMYHPDHNRYGYHHHHNPHGYHPEVNPYAYHNEHNAYGYHAQLAPFCFHPTYSPFGYHSQQNPAGYHPSSAPNNYHPQSNEHGYHSDRNPYGFHPSNNPFGYHPDLNPMAYHPEHNPSGQHVTGEEDYEVSEDEEDSDEDGSDDDQPVVV